jgi:hypothetical protein
MSGTFPPPRPEPSPDYWDYLSDADKIDYSRLQRDFAGKIGVAKQVRNNRLGTFDGIIGCVRHFAERGDDNDWRRFLVCGVCWLDNGIAVNTRQLRLLLSKCKSSINGSLQKMGYTTNVSHSESWKILSPHIPLLKDHFSELRQWTIRFKSDLPPPPPPGDRLKFPQLVPNKVFGELPPQPAASEPPKSPTCPLKFRAKMDQRANGGT